MTTDQIWQEIIAKPKWYAGIKSETGSFYSAQSASMLKRRYIQKTLSESILERVFKAHGYVLEKRWVGVL